MLYSHQLECISCGHTPVAEEHTKPHLSCPQLAPAHAYPQHIDLEIKHTDNSTFEFLVHARCL